MTGVSARPPLRSALRACRGTLLFAGLFSSAINLLLLTVSLYMLQVYDRVLTSRSLETLSYLTLAALFAVGVLGLLEMARSRLLVNASAWAERRLAPLAFARVLGHDLHERGYRSEALRDVGQVRAFLSGPGILALLDVPWAPVFLGVIFLLHPILGVVATLAAALLFALAVLNDQLTRAALKRANEVSARTLRRVEASARNAEIVDAFGMQHVLVHRWAEENSEALGLQSRAAARAGVILGISKSFRLGVQVLMLGAGAWLVLHEELTGGAMIAGSILLARALAPVEQAIGSWKQVIGARAAYRRLGAYLAEPPRRPAAATPLPAPCGALSLERVGFALHGTGRLFLKNISFVLDAGEMLAIVGPSASGKSTLARLLVGLHPPTAGHVRLDGADLFPQNRAAIGPSFGYLPQDVELFAGTVAENIARLGVVDPAALVETAKMADCHDMILRLPKGYDTEIGEDGAHLSGGQRQRIALARALYGKPRLIVLDEPNAHLDSEGEAALSRSLAAVKAGGATVVLITHRPALLAQVDKLLLLREGAVELFGPCEEVLRRLRAGPRVVQPLRANSVSRQPVPSLTE